MITKFSSYNENNKYAEDIKISEIFDKIPDTESRIEELKKLLLNKIFDIEYGSFGNIKFMINKLVKNIYIDRDYISDIGVLFNVGSTDIAYSDIYHLKKEPKQIFSESDPYGEEDWLDESVNNNYKFEIGDRVIVRQHFDGDVFVNKVGDVVFKEDDSCLVKFDTRFSDMQHNGNIEEYIDNENKCRWFFPTEIELYDPIEIENRKKIKEESRLKMIDIDPYGEEDWLEEANFNGQKKKKKREGDDIQIGDRVITYNKWIGTVISRNKQGIDALIFHISLDEIIGISSSKELFLLGRDLRKLSEEEQEEYSKKQEIKKKEKERLQDLMRDIDPYGEEEWD